MRTRLALVGLGLCLFAVWMLQHPYWGVADNDSTLYSLLALARLHPQSLAGDVFLRFGSQDGYTLFSPIFAATIRVLDLEPAASLLTLFGQIAFFGCAWLLARRLMPAPQALLAVGLLVALPSNYGVENHFSYVEGFLTPRQFVQALVLASMAAAVSRRYAICVLCLLLATVLHPIMALSGVVLLACLYGALPRPRPVLALTVALAIASFVLLLIIPKGSFAPFDATWLQLVRDTSPYLFMLQWPLESWSRIALPVAILVVGAVMNRNILLRNICRAALVMAACSVTVTLVYCDWLHIVIFTQMQPWRWLWLVEALSVLLLPVIVPDCWRAGMPARTAAILLLSAWVLRDYAITLYIALVAGVFLLVPGRLTQPRAKRLLFSGACALLIVAIAINLIPKLSSAPVPEAQWLRIWAGDGIFCAAALTVCWWIVQHRSSLRSALCMAAGATIACALCAPISWQSWTTFHYTPALRAAFEPWRGKIPARAQVIWPSTPIGAWYLLERSSYYSIHQVAGDLFSRTKALEIHRRAAAIAAALDASGQAPAPDTVAAGETSLPSSADRLDARGLLAACGDPELDFVVSWSLLGPTSLAPITPDRNKPNSQLRIYRCADLRQPPFRTPKAVSAAASTDNGATTSTKRANQVTL